MFRTLSTRASLSKCPTPSIHRRLSDMQQRHIIVKHAIPKTKDVIVYEQTTLEQDKNPLFLSSLMPQPTHKSHFKTPRSNNNYHPYHPPILTPNTIAFQQRTTLNIKKCIYPIHYQLSYLERLGFIEPITYTQVEICPGIILCTLNNSSAEQ